MVRLAAILMAAALVGLGDQIGFSQPAVAHHCRAECGSDQIQFTPGQDITVEILNRSPYSLSFSQMAYMNPQTVAAFGGFVRMAFGAGTVPNVEVYIWGESDEPLTFTLARPTQGILRIDVTAAPYGPGDRTVSVKDDGRVLIY
ncbi:MAG: hypothetical protein AAF728_20325 [Cyanobacteria bacterium P01_D01_bin.128]